MAKQVWSRAVAVAAEVGPASAVNPPSSRALVEAEEVAAEDLLLLRPMTSLGRSLVDVTRSRTFLMTILVTWAAEVASRDSKDSSSNSSSGEAEGAAVILLEALACLTTMMTFSEAVASVAASAEAVVCSNRCNLWARWAAAEEVAFNRCKCSRVAWAAVAEVEHRPQSAPRPTLRMASA